MVRLRRAAYEMVDGAIASAALFRMVNTLSGPFVAFAIIRNLSLTEQGYWYTFSSVMAIANYAELGLGQVLMQLVSHEWARLKDLNGITTTRTGDRIRSLFRIAVMWGGLIAILVSLIALPLGYFVFSSRSGSHHEIAWLGPWILVAVITPLNLLLAFLNSFFEGCQQVATVNTRRALQSLATVVTTLVVLALGGGFWALGAAQFAGFLTGTTAMVWSHRTLIRHFLIDFRSNTAVSWKQEVWPLQWRYALTWITGLFVFSLFNPLLFTMVGPEAAGRFGFTWTVIGILMGYAQIWVAARAPQFARMNSNHQWSELRRLYDKSVLMSLGTYVLGSLAMLIGIKVAHLYLPDFADRLLDPTSLTVLLVAQGFSLATLALTYLPRSFKEEPFVLMAWINAILAAVLLPLGILSFKTLGATGAFCLTQLLMFPMGWSIYLRYRRRLSQEVSLV